MTYEGWYLNGAHVDLCALATCAAYLVDEGRADEVAEMIEKPWKYGDEYRDARKMALR